MSATALLAQTPAPSDAQIREGMAGNHAAVKQAARHIPIRKAA